MGTGIAIIIAVVISAGLIFVVSKIGDPLARKIETIVFGKPYLYNRQHKTVKHYAIVLAFFLMILVALKSSSVIFGILTFAAVSIGGWVLIKILEDMSGMAADKVGDSLEKKLNGKNDKGDKRR